MKQQRTVLGFLIAAIGLALLGCANPAAGSAVSVTSGENNGVNNVENNVVANGLSYSVTYSDYNSTGGTPPAAQTKVNGTSLILAANSGSLVRTGYTFTGWNTAKDGTGTPYAEGASYTANTAVTLYAMWTINTYSVNYSTIGSTSGTAPAAQTKTHGIGLTLATNSGSLVRTGYTFAGWNTAANGSGTAYAVGASYSADAAVTLYATWTALLDTGFTVITTPVLHTVTISGSPTLHYGTLASFTSSYNGTAASYAWYMDTYTATPKGSASSLSFTPGVATDTYGSHVLMLVVTDANGLSYSGSIQISVQN